MSIHMSKKRHPNECPTCEQIPCKCAGGGGADEEISEKDDEINADKQSHGFENSALNNTCVLSLADIVGLDEGSKTTLLNQSGQLAYCTFFAGTAKHPTPTLPNNLHDEESASNSENTSLSMGMTMGAVGE